MAISIPSFSILTAAIMKLMQLCVGMVRTNCYIVYDEATREAAVIDPGDNAKSILHAVNEEQLNVRYVLLTHAHFDTFWRRTRCSKRPAHSMLCRRRTSGC